VIRSVLREEAALLDKRESLTSLEITGTCDLTFLTGRFT